MSLWEALQQYVGFPGRMLSGTKSGPSTVYWNACIFTEDGNQVWYGDADPTVEAAKFQAAANAAGVAFIVTPEQPYRWDGLEKSRKGATRGDRQPITFNPEV